MVNVQANAIVKIRKWEISIKKYRIIIDFFYKINYNLIELL